MILQKTHRKRSKHTEKTHRFYTKKSLVNFNTNNMKNNYYKSPFNRYLWYLLLTILFVSSVAIDSRAQVSYTFNFDANSTGWTGGFARFTGTTACGGAGGAMRVNLYSSVTSANLISPSTGTSNGALATITYTYKVANWSANNAATPTPWGSFNVQYGATSTGPWTTIATVSNETQLGNACISKSHTFTPPAGALFIRWAATWSAGDYYINFDNVGITQNTLTPCSGTPTGGTASASVTSGCGSITTTNLSVTGNTSGLGITYQWQSNTGSGWNNIGGATSTNYTATSVTTSTQYRCVTTCSNSGLSTNSSSANVTVTTVTAGVTSSNGTTFCGTANASLTATGGSSYSWSPFNGLSATTGASVTATDTISRTYTVTATQSGCTGTATVTINVTAPPTPITLTSNPTRFCGTGGAVALTATSVAGYNYTFSALGGAPVPTAGPGVNQASASITSTSAYQVVATDGICMVTKVRSIGVYPLPSSTLSFTPGNNQCPNAAVTVNSGLSAGNFSVASCPYIAPVVPASAGTLMLNGTATTALSGGTLDDGGWAGIPIGFSFNFFGNSFSTIAAGTNGLLMFGTVPGYTTLAGDLGQFSFSGPPYFPNTGNPGNVIALLAADLHMGTNTTNANIRYWTEGYAPNRVFVLQYFNINQYSANPAATVSCRLYETIGVVEIHITSKTFTAGATVGLQDATKTIGAVAPGRSANTTWTVNTPEAWRFSPPANYTTTWAINGVNNTPGTNQFTLSQNPVLGTTNYKLTYTNQTTGCSAAPVAAYSSSTPISSVTINPAGPTACSNVPLNAVVVGGLAPYTYAWTGPAGPLGTAASQNTSGTGNYSVNVIDACSFNGNSGAVTFTNLIAAPPNVTANSASLVSYTGFTANWAASTGATGYFLDVSTDPTFATYLPGYNNQGVGNVTSVVITGLTANTNYYYRVRATNGTCSTPSSNVINQYTGVCVPSSTYGCTDGDVIARVTLNTLDNNSGTGCPGGVGGYSDYTSTPGITTSLSSATNYSCTVYAGQYSENYAAWIDYNDNWVFETSERIGYTTTAVAGSGFVGVLGSSVSFPVSIACNPPVGPHLMRVRCAFGVASGADISPCASYSFSEIEDYKIIILAPPACPAPGLMTNTGVTYTTADMSWNMGCATATNFDFQYGPVGFALGTGTIVSNQPATISGSTGSYTLTNLVPGNSYNVYIRANCGATQSAWSITPVSITQPPCPVVLGLASSGTSSSTADVTWASQGIHTGFNIQYQLVGAGSWTNWSGNPLISNNLTITGLNSASTYQFRVVATCPGPSNALPSASFVFNTLCNAFAAPLTQNFNTGVVLPNLPVCWNKLVSGLTGAANVTTTASGLPVSGNQVAMYNGLNSSPSGQVLLVSPQLTDINQPLAPNRLTFSARAATAPVVTNANACTSSTSQYPSGTTTPAGNTLTTISTCSFTSEYSVVSLTQDSAYQIAISGNAYMSITNSTGTVVYQTGQSPQTFVAPATGTYRCYWSDGLSPSCGGTSSCFTTTIQKVTPPETGSTSSVVVGTLADPNDANTFTPKASIDVNGTHTTYTVDFFDYLGTNQYIGIKHGESTLGTNKTIYIDNIGWNPIPPCTTPLGLAVSNITVGSATFAWNPVFDAVNGYSVQYQVAGDLTWTDAPGSPIAFGTNSVLVNVLDPGTIYSWRVAAICGSGNSGYSTGTTFTTLCNPVGVPYTEGFESILANNQMPNCISTTNPGTRTYTYTAPITGGAARSGTDYAVILSGNTAPGDFIFTPALNLSGGTAYQLRFWFRRDGFSGASNTLTAWYGTSATAVAMTNAVGSSVNLNTAGTAGTYQSFTATFTPATDGVYYVGIRRFASSPSTGVLSIDDISIDLPSTCPDPSGVAVSGVPTTSSIGINWSENGTATQWDVEYGVSPYTFTGVPNVTGTSSKPYTITGLLPNTQYDIRVRSRCSASNLSDWSTVATLRTACGTISSFPWSYGFEDVTTLNTLVNCDAAYPATLAQGLGLSVYPNVSTATGTLYNRGPRTGNGFAAHYYTQGNSADSSVYFTPSFQLTAGTNYRFAMYYRSDGAGPFPRLACYYGPNQSTAGMLPIPGARVDNSANTAYALLEGYFTPATSGTYSIGVSSVYAPIPWYLSFDDMSLSVVPCLPPSAFSASVGTNSVTWSATNPVSGFTPTNYQIEMNTTGVFTGTPGITLTPTNTALGAVNTLVTGSLTPGTRYYYQYRGNCGGTQTTWVSGSFVTKPVNDDCAAAITVTPSTSILCSGTTSGSTLGGTASLGTAVNASTQCTPLQSNPDDDVWYKFVATAIQHVVTVAGSTGFDAVVEVRNSASGACPGTTPAVACTNLSSEGGVETVTLNTVIGNTYYVRVWSATTNAQTTNPVSGLPVTYGFSLCVSTPSTGPGATCATAISAGIFDTPWYSTYTTQGSDDNIGLQGSCSGTYGNGEDLVYRLSVMTPGVRTIKVTNLNGTGYIGWFLKNANNCANTLEDSTLSCAVSGSGNVAAGYYNLNPGVYYLVIDYDAILGPAYSNYRLDINKVPFNDEYTGAPVITPGIACTPTSGSVNNATPSAGVPANFSCIGDPNDDVWYRFTASAANHLITLSGNSYVDRIEAFSQVLVGATLTLNSLSCASAVSGTAQINLTGLTVGTTYYLRVYSSTSQPTLNPVLNNFSVCVQTPPSNDDICSAQILTVSAFATYVTGNNSVATDGASIGGSCANFGSNFFKDVWYRVQAPSDGVLAVSILAGSYADHDLQVWSTNNQSNPCAGTLTSVACDLSSGVGSEPYLYLTGLTSGNWYLLQVRSNASGQGGTFQIAATNAVNWTGASNTVYESPGNWFNGDAAPTLGMNIAIPVTANKPVVSSNPTLNNLYMANGAVLTLNLNTIYKVRNNITVSGSGSASINGEGRLQFTQNAATQTITGTLNAGSVELSKSAGTSVSFAANSFLKVYNVFTPTSGTINTTNNLILASDAGSTNGTGLYSTSGQAAVGTATINGPVLVQRYVKKRTNYPEYHYVSSPVSGNATVSANYSDNTWITGDAGYAYTSDPFAPQPAQFPNAWWYDESINNTNAAFGWVSATGSVAMNPGRGIAIQFNASTILDVSGSLNTGNISRAISYTDNGFNLIGNPYPQPISWNTFYSANNTKIAQGLSLWNAGANNYATFNGTTWVNNTGAGNNDKIAHSQAFFVTALPGQTGVNFTDGMRSASNAYTFFGSPENLIRLQVDNGGYSDESVIYFNENASNGYDGGYDARKLIPAMVNRPSLYSMSEDNTELAINVLSSYREDLVIPLGVITGESGKVEIRATDLSKLDAFIEVYLEDAVSGKVVNLRDQSYSVNLSQGNAGSRFFLRFKKEAPAVAAAAAVSQPGEFNIYGNDNRVFVNIPVEAKGDVRIEVMNVLGQEMAVMNVSNAGGLKELSVANAVAGNYLVKVVNGGKVYTQKVYLSSK